MSMDQHHIAAVRFLSRRFLELQGLRVALAGGTIATVVGGYLAVATPTREGALTALVAAFVLMTPGQWWLHGYYARSVGRQVPTPAKPWPVSVFVVTFMAVAVYLNDRFPEIPAGGPTMATAVALAVGLAIRDWPWRAHYLGVAVVVAGAFASMVIRPGIVDPGLTLGVTLLATGLSLVPAGLLDHWLLARLLADASSGCRQDLDRQAANASK